MSKFSVAVKRFGGFMKRNAFYFLIVLCIASVATIIALAVTYDSHAIDNPANLGGNDTPVVKPDTPDNPNTPDTPDNPDNPNTPDTPEVPDKPDKKITFISPVNSGQISRDYTDTLMVWNPSLEQYSTHTGIDFKSQDGNVYAVCDGTVKKVGSNNLDGNYIVIEHADGYQSTYKSLQEPSTLKAGAKVKQGQLIGKMSSTQGSESLDGDHLHLEMTKNGEFINPLEVILLDEK